MLLRRMRTVLAAIVGGAVLVGGLAVGVVVARADDSGTGSGNDPAAAHPIAINGGRADRPPVRSGDLTRPRRADDSMVVPSPLQALGDGLLNDIADILGVNLNDVLDQLRAGTPLGDVLESTGLDVDQVITGVRDVILQRIDDAAAAGRISEEQATRLRTLVDRFDVAEVPLRVPGRGLGRLPSSLSDLLDESGLNLDDLRAELESGVPLDQALEHLGVNPSELAERARNEALARIDEMEANGRISPNFADQLRRRIENLDPVSVFPFELHLPNGRIEGPGRLGRRQQPGGAAPHVSPSGPRSEGAGLGV